MSATSTAEHSAFFFSGRLMPAELANFNISNLFLSDRDARLELLGHGIAIWWPTQPSEEFDDLMDAARGWLRTITSAYYLETGIALEPELVGWVEALHVEVKEAMIGFIDRRFGQVPPPATDPQRNETMREAIALAERVRRAGGELERASHEALDAANDLTPQTFLSAYRALECVRRIYEPNWERREEGWKAMANDLQIQLGDEHSLLAKAGRAVRHGDLPARRSDDHVVNEARGQRRSLLAFSRTVVRTAIEHHA